jgi:hypothetical protein
VDTSWSPAKGSDLISVKERLVELMQKPDEDRRDEERIRLQELFVRAGYAPALGKVYAVLVRPFDSNESVPDDFKQTAKGVRTFLKEFLRTNDGMNPKGGSVEGAFVTQAELLRQAAETSGVLPVLERIEAALRRLNSFRGDREHSIIDVVPYPQLPDHPKTDFEGRPLGLWR